MLPLFPRHPQRNPPVAVVGRGYDLVESTVKQYPGGAGRPEAPQTAISLASPVLVADVQPDAAISVTT